jgi:hypothetical protein
MAVIKNDRDILLQSSFNRTVVVSVSISATSGRFLQLKNAGGVTPNSITLTATTSVYTVAAIKTWYYALNTSPDVWVSLGTGDTKVITSNTFLANIGEANQVFYKCTVTEFGLPDSSTIYFISYIKETDQGTVAGIGATGSKAITISAFKWSNTIPSIPSQGFTYTWSSGIISAYPIGWDSAINSPTSPGLNYTIYQLNLVIIDLTDSATTTTNWSRATLNVVGYKQDGSIGVVNANIRTAFIVTNSISPPGVVTAGIGDVLPTSSAGTWSFVTISPLSVGQYLHRVDGVYVSGANIIWDLPYISTLKVGSLSALAADLGVIRVSETGALFSSGKAFASTTPGFFLGYDGANYKFDIGNSTKFLRWDGSTLSTQGIVVDGTITSIAGNIGGNLITTTGIESPTWTSSGGVTGWKIGSDGSLNATSGTFKGAITSISGNIGGNLITPTGIESPTWTSSGNTTGWKIGSDGSLNATSGTFKGNISGAIGTFTGSITGASGTFSGALAANIVTAESIISKSATNFEPLQLSIPTGTWQSSSFYMDHTGTVSIITNFMLNFSGVASAASYILRVGIDSDTSFNEITGTAYNGNGSSMHISSNLSLGWHTLYIYVSHNQSTINHISNSVIFRSYR